MRFSYSVSETMCIKCSFYVPRGAALYTVMKLTILAFPILGGPDPKKYGEARVGIIDLCGRYPV